MNIKKEAILQIKIAEIVKLRVIERATGLGMSETEYVRNLIYRDLEQEQN